MNRIRFLYIPLFFFITGSVIASLLQHFGLRDSLFAGLLAMIASSVIEGRIAAGDVATAHSDRLRSIDETLLKAFDQLSIDGILAEPRHPYFKEEIVCQLQAFIENTDLFKGRHVTSPSAVDTFGIKGLKFTRKELKCVSSIYDYWEDTNVHRYLLEHKFLIKTRGISVQRIFVLDKSSDITRIASVMAKLYRMGVKVYYIYSDDRFIDHNWLHEDYLIQDDELLVELQCQSQTWRDEQTEFITTDSKLIQDKLRRFEIIKEHSAEFRPNTFNNAKNHT